MMVGGHHGSMAGIARASFLQQQPPGAVMPEPPDQRDQVEAFLLRLLAVLYVIGAPLLLYGIWRLAGGPAL